MFYIHFCPLSLGVVKAPRHIIFIIITALAAIVVLQAYYAYQDFRVKTVDYQRDANAALLDAVEWADKIRIDSIQGYFLAELKNPELYRIELSGNGDTLRIINARSNKRRSSLIVRDQDINTLDQEALYALIMERNREMLEDNIITFWSDSLGNVLNEYLGTIKMSKADLKAAFSRELARRSIKPKYELVYLYEEPPLQKAIYLNGKPLIPGSDQRSEVVTEIQNLRMTPEEESAVVAVVEKPFTAILMKSWKVLAISLVVLIVISYSFSFLLKTIRKQKQLSELKDDFIDNVTHELLTPIATLQLALESIERDEVIEDRERRARYIDISQREVKRISELVNNVLLTSVYDKGNPALKMESLDLDKLVEGAIEYHQATVKKPLQINFQPNDAIKLKADKQHFANVLHNLIDNSIKYSSDKGVEISITITKKTTDVELKVVDNGHGIPKAYQANIFDKFHRVVSNDMHDVKGLGVGLYYVKSVLEQMNGSISLLKSSKKGSTFLITMNQNE